MCTPLPPASRILVVDDAPVMLRILGKLLESLGYARVDGVTSAEAAMAALQHTAYDLVISDYHMGQMNGYDLYCRMRAQPRLAAIPFLLTTTQDVGSAACEEARALLRRSALKPFSAATLQARIAEACADRQKSAA
jgi:two-component system, chemotaxis family, chemotaxis protein CheY